MIMIIDRIKTINRLLIVMLTILFITSCNKSNDITDVDKNILMPIDNIESTDVKYATIVYYTQGLNYQSAVNNCVGNGAGSRKACIQFVYKLIADNKGLAEKIAEENKANMQYDKQNQKLVKDNMQLADKYNELNNKYQRLYRGNLLNSTFLFINFILLLVNGLIFGAWFIRSGWYEQLKQKVKK